MGYPLLSNVVKRQIDFPIIVCSQHREAAGYYKAI